mmetsp:Transcript_2433/g.6343  ORF Transcript_2433/g.6343 Transcript_2433/m.6343 type:complete len:261 (-) Transcript_2433:216-998(-)
MRLPSTARFPLTNIRPAVSILPSTFSSPATSSSSELIAVVALDAEISVCSPTLRSTLVEAARRVSAPTGEVSEGAVTLGVSIPTANLAEVAPRLSVALSVDASAKRSRTPVVLLTVGWLQSEALLHSSSPTPPDSSTRSSGVAYALAESCSRWLSRKVLLVPPTAAVPESAIEIDVPACIVLVTSSSRDSSTPADVSAAIPAPMVTVPAVDAVKALPTSSRPSVGDVALSVMFPISRFCAPLVSNATVATPTRLRSDGTI